MKELFNDDARFGIWLEVELAHLQTLENHGIAPEGVTDRARNRATFSIERIDELERKLHHDVVAFLTDVGDSLGEDKTFLHFGMTSSDLVDTSLALQLQRARPPIEATLRKIGVELRRLAETHRNTVCAGRTHGVHAEPTSFGYKILTWYTEMGRQHKRLIVAFDDLRRGKISGAVGTAAHLPVSYEEETLARLGLEAEPAATQVIPRDRHAALLSAVASLGASLERAAVEIRHLQRSEVREAQEPFARGQKGSSAMPHKRNPIVCERISGLARVLRGNAHAAVENIALWHERDISHSSVERVIFPDSLILLDYLLDRFLFVVSGLQVFPQHMQTNLERTGGLVYSQRVLLALTEATGSRETAYRIVQRQAMKTWDEGGQFQDHLSGDSEVTEHLDAAALAELFDPAHYLRNLDQLFDRSLGERWEDTPA